MTPPVSELAAQLAAHIAKRNEKPPFHVTEAERINLEVAITKMLAANDAFVLTLGPLVDKKLASLKVILDDIHRLGKLVKEAEREFERRQIREAPLEVPVRIHPTAVTIIERLEDEKNILVPIENWERSQPVPLPETIKDKIDAIKHALLTGEPIVG